MVKSVVVAVCLGIVSSIYAYDIPSGGQELLPVAMSGWRFGARPEAQGEGRIVSVSRESFREAWRITHRAKPSVPYAVTLHADLNGPIRQGDVILISFYLRALASENESGTVKASFYVQQNKDPWNKTASVSVEAGASWEHFVFPMRADRLLPIGGGNVSIHLGYEPQSLEIAAMQVINYGPSWDPLTLPQTKGRYPGQSLDAPWRAAAAERIERYRKADLSVSVRDRKGKPIPQANVTVSMQRHAFDFGCVVNPSTFVKSDRAIRTYRDKIARYFNKAPLESGFRWQNWFKPSPSYVTQMKADLDRTIDWLQARDIEVRGHYLMWAPLSEKTQPADLLDDPSGLRAALYDHIVEKSAFAGTRLGEWDAVNHIIGWGTTYADLLSNDIYADVIRWGHNLNPHAEMWINEGQVLPGGSRRDSYYAIAEYLKEQDVPLHGVGFMGHFTSGSLTGIDELYEVLDRFAGLGYSLQLTEFDVDVGFDQLLQAEYLRDVMTIAFSHPAMEGVVMWGFWEGRHWKPNAALWQRDWTLKPAGQAWLDLVFDQWWTETEGATNRDGHYRMRGFLGDYEIKVSLHGQEEIHTVTLGSEGLELPVEWR